MAFFSESMMHFPKIVPKTILREDAQDSDLAHFVGDLADMLFSEKKIPLGKSNLISQISTLRSVCNPIWRHIVHPPSPDCGGGHKFPWDQ